MAAPRRLSPLLRGIGRIGLTAIAACGFASGVLRARLPPPSTVSERLAAIPSAGLPLAAPVTIYWNDQHIPFVEAVHDEDAAFALGLVHAHLRLGQMEVLRRLSQGRLSEMAGPIPRAIELDHALRIINFGKTSPAVYAAMPADTKAWLDAFVAGINWYQAKATALPHEYALLGFQRAPWRPEEVLTLGRLASTDVNWLVWFRLLALRERPDWPALWAAAIAPGQISMASFVAPSGAALSDLQAILAMIGRTGSNAMAVGTAKTGTGAALIASDPHLGLALPNAWLIAGVKSPSYHMVGLMVPGIPFIAVGRNEHVAWGGTNLRAASSDLFDVSALPDAELTSRKEMIARRWWFNAEVTVRESPLGPVLSDSRLFPSRAGERLALRWIGHDPSDEISAMLRVNKARDFGAFRAALEGFAISPQNFIYADYAGNVGQVIGTHIPARTRGLPADLVRPPGDAIAWQTILTARDLPCTYNPPEGFVASANNKPAEAAVPIGYFFSGNDRVARMQEVLGGLTRVGMADLKALQLDTMQRSALQMRDAFLVSLAEPALSPAQARVRDLLAAWNGHYDAGAAGPVAFEVAMATFLPAVIREAEFVMHSVAGGLYQNLLPLILLLPANQAATAAIAALDAAQKALSKTPRWGDLHRVKVAHLLGRIPVIGKAYHYYDRPASGSRETLLKTHHALTAERHFTSYGAQARYLSDLAEIDANWFVLLGGNDGWHHSSTFHDQVEAFMRGDAVQMPLSLARVRASFPHRTTLTPA
jgi:penicillin amidase